MVRFVIGLLAAATVFFGWQWYVKDPAEASGPRGDLFQAATDPARTDVAAAARLDGGAPPAAAAADQAQDKTLAAGRDDRIVQAVLETDAAALAVGFRTLRTAVEPLRRQLAAALARVADAAAARADADGMLRVLGSGNAFLHTAEGRRQLATTMTEILRMDNDKAIIRTTALLEQCMRGPIAKTDQAAFAAVNDVYRHHKTLVSRVVFNPSRLTKARSHKVKPGETLGRIAARYREQGLNVEGWTLCYVNRVGRPNLLQAGKTIKIPMEPIWAKIEKESFLMAVYVGDTIVRLYWVGHGREGCNTPETTFTVAEKLPQPDWYAPDGNVYPFGHQKNVLGRYFVKFDHDELHGFGAHGTAEPETIRTRSSLGCIRMHDADIEEFFRFMPRRAKVVVAAAR